MALRVDDVDLVRDRALVERFQEGDAAAFETLYRRYFARLARFCQKRVGDPHDAEEIAQEAFTRALRALPTFEGERRFYPWMTVIAGRLCVDHHRRRGRSEPSASVDLGVIDGDQERIVDAVDVEILSTALGRIAPRHRDVLDLREQHGWSYKRIAEHYDVTQGTVEALLFRARKALQREFMAVAGDGHWAIVGVVWAALARVVSIKSRVEAWTAGAVSAASGPAMAAAITVTAVSGAAVGSAVFRDLRGGARPTEAHLAGPDAVAEPTPLHDRPRTLEPSGGSLAGVQIPAPAVTPAPIDAVVVGGSPAATTGDPSPASEGGPQPERSGTLVGGLDQIGLDPTGLVEAMLSTLVDPSRSAIGSWVAYPLRDLEALE